MNTELLLKNLRTVPDFPIKGIQFYDITTLLKNSECLNEIADCLYEQYKDKGITKVVGVESRGFILGGILASRLNAGFVLARKPGKLPADTLEQSYNKEYGTDSIQIHKDAITAEDTVLIHDDLIATGGSLKAVYDLVKQFNPQNCLVNVVIELVDLKGKDIFNNEIEITSLLKLKGA